MTDPNTVTILLAEYLDLKRDSDWLAALESAGVDNWDGIDYAKEIFNDRD